jgi:hypothetical protein
LHFGERLQVCLLAADANWLVCSDGVGRQLVETMPLSGQDWQDDAATVGSFGFKVTTSLSH